MRCRDHCGDGRKLSGDGDESAFGGFPPGAWPGSRAGSCARDEALRRRVSSARTQGRPRRCGMAASRPLLAMWGRGPRLAMARRRPPQLRRSASKVMATAGPTPGRFAAAQASVAPARQRCLDRTSMRARSARGRRSACDGSAATSLGRLLQAGLLHRRSARQRAAAGRQRAQLWRGHRDGRTTSAWQSKPRDQLRVTGRLARRLRLCGRPGCGAIDNPDLKEPVRQRRTRPPHKARSPQHDRTTSSRAIADQGTMPRPRCAPPHHPERRHRKVQMISAVIDAVPHRQGLSWLPPVCGPHASAPLRLFGSTQRRQAPPEPRPHSRYCLRTPAAGATTSAKPIYRIASLARNDGSRGRAPDAAQHPWVR